MTTKIDTGWETLGGPSTRTPRSLETRERTTTKRSWAEPSILPDPEPQDGFKFKWVRTASRGVSDNINFQKRRREGWEPVRAEDHPELMIDLSLEGAQKSGQVEVGGLILCKMPEEMVAQRTAHYHDRTQAELTAADDSYLRDSDERMRKVVDRKRKTVFGR